jgi:hypothetical protein
MANRHAEHGRLVEEILLRLGSRPDCMVWRNVTGRFLAPRTGAWVNVGTPGAPDILGVVLGRAIAVEAKTGTGRLGLAQRKWKAAFENRGGVYVEARSADEAERAALGCGSTAYPWTQIGLEDGRIVTRKVTAT